MGWSRYLARNRDTAGDVMRKLQIAIYILMLVVAYCEQEEIPLGVFIYHQSMRFWYGLAEFAGRQGIKAEKNYHQEVMANG